MKINFLISLLLFFSITVSAQLKSPEEFFRHDRGEHFTPHHQLVDYYYHISENSELVQVKEYGRTNQDRPMLLAFISSQENMADLDDIRMDHLKTTGIYDGVVQASNHPAIVWISCSVHGNEAAGSEAAPQILWELVNPQNPRTKEWLKNLIVVIDPCINPDGYSRYTHWIRDVAGEKVNTDLNDIEHQEPWPGGRTNHYLFDLNRDWAWQTQVESQQRMRVYNEWLPHIHIDLHEMGQESPYYFAPAAKPYHEYITQWQRDFQTVIGKNHAKYFDEKGWLYFTKEVFDLLYPSYGDTYPVFNGAIGMTYEQGGSSRGGRAVKTENGEILSLKDRIQHHTLASLSTIEISSLHADSLVNNFSEFWQVSQENPPGKYKSYIIRRDSTGNRLKALTDFLDKQQIRYHAISRSQHMTGFDFRSRLNGSFTAEKGDILISAYQPKAVLTQVLFDPETAVEDSVTYDITAWSLPYAYGLEACAMTNKITDSGQRPEFRVSQFKEEKAYAYVINWSDLEAVKLLSHLYQEKIDVRINSRPFAINGKQYSEGNVIITKADNRSMADFDMTIREVSQTSSAVVDLLKSGFVDSGPDLGSNRMDLIKRPKVVVLKGEGISSNDFGQVRWYFDQVIDYPLTVVDQQDFERLDIDDYNTLILPNGRYSWSDKKLEKISHWIDEGGRVIAIGNATRLFQDKKGYALKAYTDDKEKTEAEEADKEDNLQARYLDHGGEERRRISNMVPGAIFSLQMDSTHPLGSGLGDTYYSLRNSSLTYPLMTGAKNVGYIGKDAKIIGFAGSKIRSKLMDSVVFASEDKGKGKVIYMVDSPLFRGFWYNGLLLFSNAVFLDW